MSFITLLSTTIDLPRAGVVDVEGAAQQATSGSPSRWGFQLSVNGELLWNPGGAAPNDCVYLGGCKYCEAGPVTIELRWMADPTVTVPKAFLKIRGFSNTAG